jgi:hypothetical protein
VSGFGCNRLADRKGISRAGVVCTHGDREYLYLVAKRHPTKHPI